MDRVLFGDNQFFGVNHMSEEKARAQAMRFQDLPAVLETAGPENRGPDANEIRKTKELRARWLP